MPEIIATKSKKQKLFLYTFLFAFCVELNRIDQMFYFSQLVSIKK